MLSEVKQMCIKTDLEGLVLSGLAISTQKSDANDVWVAVSHFFNVYPYLGKDPI